MIYINNGNAATIRIGDVWHTVPHGGTIDTGADPVQLAGPWTPADNDADDLTGLDIDALLGVVESEGVDIGAASTVNGIGRKIRETRTRATATKTKEKP